VTTLASAIGERRACATLGIPRPTIQRHRHPAVLEAPVSRARRSPRRLSAAERQHVLDIIHAERFVDKTVREIYATLLDEGEYVCSISTMYRVLREAGETRERRGLATHPAWVKPELAATAPNQVWSWDITKILGPQKWTYYYLYVILDVFSRYVVAWRLEYRESATLAKELFDWAITRDGVDPRQLTVHADGGPSMQSKLLTQFFMDLGVLRSRSRPHVSDDNPFSEAQFKTLKYMPTFPGYFANIQQGRDWCEHFFPWYNDEHRHSGIALLTPRDVHEGHVDERLAARSATLAGAWQAHPERFVRGKPQAPGLAPIVYINQPDLTQAA
jgi:putative transposase